MTAAAPAGLADRISALDVARGFALLGILIMNSSGMALYGSAYFNFAADGGDGLANLVAWGAMTVYFEGAMRGLFSLLFGAGIVLFLARAERSNPAIAVDLHARRMLWLIAFGLVNTFVLLYPYDILLQYGIAGLFLFALRKLSARSLFAIFAALFVIANLFAIVEVMERHDIRAAYEEAEAASNAGEELTEDQTAAIEEWTGYVEGWSGSEDNRTEEADTVRNRDLLTLVPAFWSYYASDFTGGGFWEFLFDVAFVVVLGMALARNGILLGGAPRMTYVWLLLGGYGVGLALGVWRTVVLIEADFGIAALDVLSLTYHTRRIALAVGHVGLIFCLVEFGVFRGLQSVLAAIGKMAFTNYLTQSLLQVLVWYGPGLALHGQLERHQIWYVIAAIWAIQAVFSVVWLRHFRFGPLEWLWRTLTYGERQPIRLKPRTP